MDDTLYRVGVPKIENSRVALASEENRSIGGEGVGQLAERGFTTILGSHEEERGRAAAAKGMSVVLQVRRLGVIAEKDVQRLASDIEEEFGQIDVLVNNAGVAIDREECRMGADASIHRESERAGLLGSSDPGA